MRPGKDCDQLAALSRRRNGNRRFRAVYAAKWPQRQAKNRRLAAVNHIYLKLQIDVALQQSRRGMLYRRGEGRKGQLSMYEAYYGLREKPFSILPDPELIYWGSNHRLAYAMLEFGVMNSAGFTVITGEIGSGKTTLVRCLLRKLDPNINVGLISNTPHGRKELLQWVMMSLNQPFDEKYSELLFRFQQYLRAQHAENRRTLIIVDEAQNLQPDALESLRMLSNINADKDQFLQLMLVGQPQLRGPPSLASANPVCATNIGGFSPQAFEPRRGHAVHRLPFEGRWRAFPAILE